MKLTTTERAIIEHALDELVVGVKSPRLVRLYERAIAIVRDRPTGMRKLRSDHNTKRPTAQQELPGSDL